MYSSILSLTSTLDGVGGQRHALVALPLEQIRCPLCRRLGGPPGRSGWVRKILPPSGFDLRTVQPADNRYTDHCGNTVAAEFAGVATDADFWTSIAGHIYTMLHRE